MPATTIVSRRWSAALLGLLCALPAAAQDAASDLGPAFSTRNAAYIPVSFTDIPGWDQESFGELTRNFVTNCSAMQRRAAWAPLCKSFTRLPAGDANAARKFFHDNFFAYQLASTARNPTGKLTGYFEPLIPGSLRQEGPFKYPIYATPNDMYEVSGSTVGSSSSRWLKISQHQLVGAEAGSAGARNYQIQLVGANLNPRDKRYRVRIVGDRILPYYTRKEIDATGIDAPVLAWVADPYKLYSMQIQGSGKIAVKGGGLIRLAYAGQNGHPFLPNATRGDSDAMLLAIKARGLDEPISEQPPAIRTRGAKSAPSVDSDAAAIIAALKGGGAPAAASATSSGKSAPAPAAKVDSAEVEAMIALLLRAPAAGAATAADEVSDVAEAPQPSAKPRVSTKPKPKPKLAKATAGSKPGAKQVASAKIDMSQFESVAGSGPVGKAEGQGRPVPATGINDPSFVFFRRIGDGPEGPIGALGVPLSPGRSMAVDPRAIPLGAPVFIAGNQPGVGGPMRRLVFAQDTGGAIRGSVRGDFFWGFGDKAGKMALATNQAVQMWLLLPKSVAANAAQAGIKTRGSTPQLRDCAVPDEEFCVEE